MRTKDERMIELFYLLGRDHLPLGTLEEVVEKLLTSPDLTRTYSNLHLEDWARDVVARLT